MELKKESHEITFNIFPEIFQELEVDTILS